MFFKSANYYEIFDYTPIDLSSAQLAAHAFKECGQLVEESIGFVSPLTGEAGKDTDLANLAYEVNGNIMLCVRVDQKIVPADAVRREVKKRADLLHDKTGEELGNKALKQLAEQVRAEMVKTALVKSALIYGFIHKPTGLVVVDAGSLKKAEVYITLVRAALGTFPAVPVEFIQDLSAVMTRWMAHGYPDALAPLYGVTIKLTDEGMASFKNVDLDDDLIVEHITNGGQVKRIELNYADRLSLCLQDDGLVKKIKFLEMAEDAGEDASVESLFDADFVLNAAVLVELCGKMRQWFGGN